METEQPGIDEKDLNKYKAIVSKIEKGTIAQKAGIKKNDRIVSINDHILRDLIDYKYAVADVSVRVLVERSHGEFIEFDIEKDYEEDLGISFETPVFDNIMRCTNNCIFCFMDQMPDGLRRSLYLKDEDYRLSFLYGNFITMTGMSEEDFERIKTLNLSPLYISVHSTNLKLRKQILRSHKAENIMKQLEEITSSGISIHTQVVAMPGINDGEELVKTIEDLSYYYPQLESIGIVPVGLTAHRTGLYDLRGFTAREAATVINQVKPFQNKFRRRFGKGLVYLADEFYLLAEQPFPPGEEYDEYPQFENGIGIGRSFQDDFHSMRHMIPSRLKYPKEFTIVTGTLAAASLKNVVNDLNTKVSGLNLNIAAIENDYFGRTVTVAGLITGRDIIEHFKKNPKSVPDHPIVIPRVMLNEDIFLDDISIRDVASETGCSIEVVEPEFSSLLELIVK